MAKLGESCHTYLDNTGYSRNLTQANATPTLSPPILDSSTLRTETMSPTCTAIISPAEFPRDREAVTTLFTAYAKSLEIDLAFQNFDFELSSLPGKYCTENGGALYLARTPSSLETSSTSEEALTTSEVIGCVALRAFNAPRICELKRLYITPRSRGLGAGRKLLDCVIERARGLGYEEMLLDTLPSMVEARTMYGKCGFEECDKYYDSPIEGTRFMRLKLHGREE